MTDLNRVVTYVCPGCTRMLVVPFGQTWADCEHCDEAFPVATLTRPTFEVPPVNRFDHDPPLEHPR